MNAPDDVLDPVASLLAAVGVSAPVTGIGARPPGGNNRIYRVETAGGPYLAKRYFRHEGDRRDRLATEFAFLEYAAFAAPGFAPRPLAKDAARGFALYEFVEGRPFRPGEVGAPEVAEAVRFFRALNKPAHRTRARLSDASEAAFSLDGHLGHVERRIAQLRSTDAISAADREGADVIAELDGAFAAVARQVLGHAIARGWDRAFELPPGARALSPSDFGFHNALREPGGAIRFIDFEYAGWDDPAKTTGDFFSQLAVPVPGGHFASFADEVCACFPEDPSAAERARLLRPVYAAKWACIALNVFLPVHLARRKFADPALDEAALKAAQLAKARHCIQSMKETVHGLH